MKPATEEKKASKLVGTDQKMMLLAFARFDAFPVLRIGLSKEDLSGMARNALRRKCIHSCLERYRFNARLHASRRDLHGAQVVLEITSLLTR